jgi:hypothetical protein
MASKNYLLPKAPNPKGQAELILAGAGLALLKPKFYRVDLAEISREEGDKSSGAVASELEKSKFGLPMFDVFKFNCSTANSVTYTASKDFGGGEVIIDGSFVFETALLTVNQTKNIVKTAIAGQDGTVKEFMSEGDFVINLKGVIAGDTANQRPDFITLDKLVQYLKAPLALPVSCNFLNEWNINSVVIESYSLSQREGTRNIIDIDINMLSDSPIELSSRGGSNARYF